MERSEDKNKRIFDKSILSSAHINFLFGAGVNGTAFPQLKGFKESTKLIKEKGGDTTDGFEAGIDSITSESDREEIKKAFITDFREALEGLDGIWKSNPSLNNLRDLLRTTHALVADTQNRVPSMKQINVFTLNYDTVIERLLDELGFFYNEISASNADTRALLMDVIGFDYRVKKYVPSYMVSKLHGDIDNPIIPGRTKYQEVLNEDYFEIAFNMKSQLCKPNAVLIVIGYSGKDNHINKILQDCLNAGLTVYWYKYNKDDYVPFNEKTQVYVRNQDDLVNRKDCTQLFVEDVRKVWEEK